jgi:hypothetical protein
MSLIWTKERDGEHNGKPVYEYAATCEDRAYHIVWAYDAGFGYTCVRKDAEGHNHYLGLTWGRTLKFCKAQCELIDAKYLDTIKCPPQPVAAPNAALVPNIAGSFKTFDDWVIRATGALTNNTCESSGATVPVPAMCVDTKGRRCYQGSDFMRARDEGAFPVVYFWDCTNGK